jgi:hypothetical protein
MRYISIVICFLFLTIFCHAQNTLPGKIIGRIPNITSTKTFQIQVGAFLQEKNAEKVCLRLHMNALNPIIKKSADYSRVFICGIPANQVYNFLVIIRQAGFNEVIIREDIKNENIENVQIIVPNIEFSITDEFSNSEIEQKINSLSDDEFLELLSLMEAFPDKNIVFLIDSINKR